MESRADRRTSRALHTVTTHANASDRPTYFIGELRLSSPVEFVVLIGHHGGCVLGVSATFQLIDCFGVLFWPFLWSFGLLLLITRLGIRISRMPR